MNVVPALGVLPNHALQRTGTAGKPAVFRPLSLVSLGGSQERSFRELRCNVAKVSMPNLRRIVFSVMLGAGFVQAILAVVTGNALSAATGSIIGVSGLVLLLHSLHSGSSQSDASKNA
jgi:hypothetical protein